MGVDFRSNIFKVIRRATMAVALDMPKSRSGWVHSKPADAVDAMAALDTFAKEGIVTYGGPIGNYAENFAETFGIKFPSLQGTVTATVGNNIPNYNTAKPV
jgi:hypothetical protein